jgi:hypothetical protein
MARDKIFITVACALMVFIAGGLFFQYAWEEDLGNVRSSTTALTQTINPGTLSVDIVDGSYVTVGSPTVSMSAIDFSFACTSSSGTFGTATEQIYVKNPDAADAGWDLTIAASSPTDLWTSATVTDYDFNDPTTSGCEDGGDTDGLGGQMTIDASGGTLAAGACSSCTTANITKGSSSAFEEGVNDSITLLSAASSSDDIGDWTLQGVSVSQTIPPEQPAASDYTINLSLTVTAL